MDNNHGFKLVSSEPIKEINGRGDVYLHEKSGLTLLHLPCDDANKTFYIGFSTLPQDSTGVPHIIEHSVLAGSKKFPLREPFVELIKGSLNTFLNAMTAEDFTCYPVASLNFRDYMNLTDVYLDAVFNPLIHTTKEIFMQEGWHYELSDSGELSINGVVYNEMKGAMSDPGQVLQDALGEAHTNCCRFNSGGDPAVIPSLSYEQFCAFHKKFYHPSNAIAIIYGDMELEPVLALVESYVKDYDRGEAMNIEADIPLSEPKRIERVYPINAGEDKAGKAYCMRSWFGSDIDVEELTALEVLTNALFNAEAAPVKRAVMESGLCAGISAYFNSGAKTPNLAVSMDDMNEEDFDKLNAIVDAAIQNAYDNGIDQKLIEACLNKHEFNLREEPAGLPKGLMVCWWVQSGFIHDGDMFKLVKYEQPIKVVREKIGTDYFKNLIKSFVIDNPWQADVRLRPEPGMAEKKEAEQKVLMAATLAKMSEEEKTKILQEAAKMKQRQTTPDSEDALATIPQLKLSDIGESPNRFDITEEKLGHIPAVINRRFTGGVVYLSLMFNANGLTDEELPYASLLCRLLGKMDTDDYGFEQLSTELLLHTGGVSFMPQSFRRNGDEGARCYINAGVKSLKATLDNAVPAVCSMMASTKFDDTARLAQKLGEIAAENRAELIGEGFGIAKRRIASYYSQRGKFDEICGGYSYHLFIKKLMESGETGLKACGEKLKKLAEKLFVQENFAVMLTGEEDELNVGRQFVKKVAAALGSGKKAPEEKIFTLKILNEAIATPADVQYCAQGYDYKKLGFEFDGALTVAKTILSTDYLWQKLRVQGGAYGATLAISQGGTFTLCTYRDPNLANTYKVYNEMADYLAAFDPSQREMEKYILGTLQTIDAPMAGIAGHLVALTWYMSGITGEDMLKTRAQVLAARAENIREKAALVRAVIAKNSVCTVGNSEKIKADKEMFSTVIDG